MVLCELIALSYGAHLCLPNRAYRVHYWADVLQTLKGVVGVDPIVVGVPG